MTIDFADTSVTLQKKPPGRLSSLGLPLIVNTSVNPTERKYLDNKSYFQQFDQNINYLISFIVQDRAVSGFCITINVGSLASGYLVHRARWQRLSKRPKISLLELNNRLSNVDYGRLQSENECTRSDVPSLIPYCPVKALKAGIQNVESRIRNPESSKQNYPQFTRTTTTYRLLVDPSTLCYNHHTQVLNSEASF